MVTLGQGAKPGHGSILPAEKVSRVIAETRGVPKGKVCISPSCHSAFSPPRRHCAPIAPSKMRRKRP
jgi:glutamate synthase domain-containing protein 2